MGAELGLSPSFSPAVCAIVLAATFSAVPARAQICGGRTSFNLASTQVEVNAGVNESSHGFGVAVGHGTDRLFGAVSIATHSLDNEGGVETIGVTLGADPPVTPDNKIHVCPSITVGYVSDAGADNDPTGIGVSVAGDAGLLAVNTSTLQVIPTIGLDLRYHGVGRTAGVFVHPGRRHSTFSAGIGFVIVNRLSLVPKLLIPFGPLARSALQITVGYNVLVGHRSARRQTDP